MNLTVTSKTITTIIRPPKIELFILINESFGSLFLSITTLIIDIKNTNNKVNANIEIAMTTISVSKFNT
jgi:hypothetical protein